MGNWCHFPLLIGVISSHYIITGSEAHLVFVQINWTLQTDVFENSGDRILEILDVSPDSLWAPLFFCDFTTGIPINLPDPTMDLHKGIIIYSDPVV